MWRKLLLGCGVVSSALYVAADLIAARGYAGYRYFDQTFSELLAAEAPTRPFMVATAGVGYTLFVTAFGVGVWTTATGRSGRLAGGLLVAYAVTGAVGGVLFRTNSRAVLAAGAQDWRGSGHPWATIVMSIAVLLAIGVGAQLRGRRFRWYSYATVLALLIFGGLAGLQTGRMVADQPTPWMGLIERVNIYATMAWVAALAVGLLRAQPNDRPRPATRPVAAPR